MLWSAMGAAVTSLVALTLAPQLSPIRNKLARVKGRGKKAEFKAVTAFNNTALNGFIAEGTNGPIVQTTTTDITATYKTMALADKVTFEQQWAGAGFLDSKAFAVVNLLRAMMIQEETNILFGQAAGAANATEQAPGALGAAPNLAAAQVSAGGSGSGFAATTYYVVQTCFTGMGESAPSAAAQSVTPGAGQNLTLTPVFPAGQPVVGFNFYIGAAAGGPFYKVLAANLSGSAPSSANLPGNTAVTWLSNGDPVTVAGVPAAANGTPPGSDGSASANAWNGIYSQMWGGAGATLTKQGGALTLAGINNLLKAMWNSAKADPDGVWCNAQESQKLTSLTLGAGAPYQVLVPDGNVGNAAANFRVARFTNAVTGSELPVNVHPTIPQGSMLFLSLRLPPWYVPTDVQSVIELDLPQDYVEIDYPPTATTAYWQVEVRLFGTPKLFIPALQGALYAINNS